MLQVVVKEMSTLCREGETNMINKRPILCPVNVNVMTQ